jgi:hypothetical protein
MLVQTLRRFYARGVIVPLSGGFCSTIKGTNGGSIQIEEKGHIIDLKVRIGNNNIEGNAGPFGVAREFPNTDEGASEIQEILDRLMDGDFGDFSPPSQHNVSSSFSFRHGGVRREWVAVVATTAQEFFDTHGAEPVRFFTPRACDYSARKFHAEWYTVGAEGVCAFSATATQLPSGEVYLPLEYGFLSTGRRGDVILTEGLPTTRYEFPFSLLIAKKGDQEEQEEPEWERYASVHYDLGHNKWRCCLKYGSIEDCVRGGWELQKK